MATYDRLLCLASSVFPFLYWQSQLKGWNITRLTLSVISTYAQTFSELTIKFDTTPCRWQRECTKNPLTESAASSKTESAASSKIVPYDNLGVSDLT